MYVDDIVITRDDEKKTAYLKSYLHKHFQTKDLRELKYFLAIIVPKASNGIFITQRKYVIDLLRETGMSGSKPINCPMNPHVGLVFGEEELSANHARYHCLVGKLNYFAVTRPDILFPDSVVSRLISDPRVPNWNDVIRILRYLKSFRGKGLLYKNFGRTKVTSFTNTDYTSSLMNKNSQS